MSYKKNKKNKQNAQQSAGTMATPTKLALILGVPIILLTTFFIGNMVYKSMEADRTSGLAEKNAAVFMGLNAPTLGPADAAVTLVEFLDPACESCRRSYPVVKEILENYPDQIQLVVRYAPFHQGADQVVRALEAARLQGKYWEALETLFKYQPRWAIHHKAEIDRVWPILADLGLDIERLQRDMNGPGITARIERDMQDLRTLNVRATPTFFVNGKPLQQRGRDGLIAAIEAEL